MSNHIHSLNSSPTKQKYSFGKDQRFREPIPKTDVYYLPQIQKDRRSALIGYGQRSLGTISHDKSILNSPHAYSIPSSIDNKKGNAFHGGRHNIGSYMANIGKFSVPAPCQYSLPSTLQKGGVSLKQKLPDFSLKGVQNIPGPGAYSIPSTLKIQNQHDIMDSKFTNPSSVKMSHSLDISRRKQPITFIPGPGQYDIQKYGIGNPQNPLQKHENIKFTKGTRQPLAKRDAQKIPGPGLYKIYSQFD